MTDADLGAALAVGDAKQWDRPLDQALSVGGDPFSNKNPGWQIAFYMQHTGLPWGMLTNGRLWRLYHSPMTWVRVLIRVRCERRGRGASRPAARLRLLP